MYANLLSRLRRSTRRLPSLSPGYSVGRVRAIRGTSLQLQYAGLHPGQRLEVEGGGAAGRCEAEVVSVRGEQAEATLCSGPRELRVGARVRTRPPRVLWLGRSCLGSVLRADGTRLQYDQCNRLREAGAKSMPLQPRANDLPTPITVPLSTGVPAIDLFCTLGRGQRVALIAPPGAGKTTLLGQIAAGSEAEVIVLALVGERQRELEAFLNGPLKSARDRCVVVFAPGDAPASERALATLTATTVAEFFRTAGKQVLLLVDSLTRHARAKRELDLDAGASLGPQGWPCSTMMSFPTLLERVGCRRGGGSISAIYTLLDEAAAGAVDPLAEEMRSLLDGQIVLSRQLAERGHWPAIDLAASQSRLIDSLLSQDPLELARRGRAAFIAYQERRELMILGAWEPGQDAEGDEALACWPGLQALLTQPPKSPFEVKSSSERLFGCLASALGAQAGSVSPVPLEPPGQAFA